MNAHYASSLSKERLDELILKYGKTTVGKYYQQDGPHLQKTSVQLLDVPADEEIEKAIEGVDENYDPSTDPDTNDPDVVDDDVKPDPEPADPDPKPDEPKGKFPKGCVSKWLKDEYFYDWQNEQRFYLKNYKGNKEYNCVTEAPKECAKFGKEYDLVTVREGKFPSYGFCFCNKSLGKDLALVKEDPYTNFWSCKFGDASQNPGPGPEPAKDDHPDGCLDKWTVTWYFFSGIEEDTGKPSEYEFLDDVDTAADCVKLVKSKAKKGYDIAVTEST